MNNYALYYPTIEFANYQWLWQASLIWDRIYRIVPEQYEPDDCSNVRILAESGEIGIPIRPSKYAADIAKEFMNKLSDNEWDAAALSLEMTDDYKCLHSDKVDVVLRDMIIAQGSAKAHNEWLNVPTTFAAHYMTYLANNIATRNNLQMLSDNVPAWTGATYFKLDGKIDCFLNNENTHQLATLVVRDFLPDNILSIHPEQILKFREKYRHERKRFLSSIQNSAKLLSDCDDSTIVKDMIIDIQKDIDSALSDFRRSLSILRINSFTGLKSIIFPIITQVASIIGGESLSTENLMIMKTGGIALGLISGLCDFRQKKRKLQKECDYSYLLHMRNQWKGVGRYNNDYNYYLYRELEEFIND